MATTNKLQGFTDKVVSEESGRRPYSLDEDLAIMDMLQAEPEISLETIAKVTGRSIPSLRYRYKDKNRGALKLLLDDPTGAKLYESHGVDYVDEADIEKRIETFKAALPGTA